MPPARLRQGQRTGGVLHPSRAVAKLPWSPCFPWQSPPSLKVEKPAGIPQDDSQHEHVEDPEELALAEAEQNN